MYKGTPYVNKHVKKWDQEKFMDYHHANLTQVRPLTGTLEHEDVRINNKKAQMIKEARFTQIERQNRILLQKISSIMSKPGNRNKTNKRLNGSLNSDLRKRQMQNIQVENAKLLKRLQDKKSDYETEKFRITWRKQKNIIKNLANFPQINDSRRKKGSVSVIGGRNPNSTYHSQHNLNKGLELCKMKFIDGTNFLVTVRLSKNTLQIIGDSKDKRDIKVIEIEKKEAVEFIEQQCGGKIQGIFDCLKYDRVDEVLYLLGKDIGLSDVQEGPVHSKSHRREENPEFDISAGQQKNQNQKVKNQKVQNQKVQNQKQEVKNIMKDIVKSEWAPVQNPRQSSEANEQEVIEQNDNVELNKADQISKSQSNKDIQIKKEGEEIINEKEQREDNVEEERIQEKAEQKEKQQVKQTEIKGNDNEVEEQQIKENSEKQIVQAAGQKIVQNHEQQHEKQQKEQPIIPNDKIQQAEKESEHIEKVQEDKVPDNEDHYEEDNYQEEEVKDIKEGEEVIQVKQEQSQQSVKEESIKQMKQESVKEVVEVEVEELGKQVMEEDKKSEQQRDFKQEQIKDQV